jgi:hypothetical protein
MESVLATNYHIYQVCQESELKPGFDKLLLEAIDEALSYIGESSKKSLYHQLEEDFQITKHEIPQKIRSFNRAIGEIFKEGAFSLQILMMKRIHYEMGGSLDWPEDDKLTFTKYVMAVKQNSLKNEIDIRKMNDVE